MWKGYQNIERKRKKKRAKEDNNINKLLEELKKVGLEFDEETFGHNRICSIFINKELNICMNIKIIGNKVFFVIFTFKDHLITKRFEISTITPEFVISAISKLERSTKDYYESIHKVFDRKFLRECNKEIKIKNKMSLIFGD